MVWPPRIPKGALDNMARRALAFQRTHFFKQLKVERALVPLESISEEAAIDADAIANIKAKIEAACDALTERHETSLPASCARAPGHLQIATLAIAAQRTLLHEARSNADRYMTSSGLKVRSVVADALGVVAPADGTAPKAVAVQYVPNMIALGMTGALWIESRRRSMVERMVDNFQRDLGPAFDVQELEDQPEPSFAVRRCFYASLLREEGEHELLAPLFTALHEPTFSGVPGFEFVANDEVSGQCSFIFR